MIKEEVEILIAKYCVNQISDSEIKELKVWLKKKDNKELFKQYVEVNYGIEQSKEITSLEKGFHSVNTKIFNKNSFSLRNKPFLKYAAIFIVLLGLGVVFKQIAFKPEELEIAEETITLEFNNGIVKNIDPKKDIELLSEEGSVIAQQLGTELIYQTKALQAINQKPVAPIYNELTVPYGQNFKLTLADGTQIQLNSGSSLRYPVQFFKNTKREVFLNGEAYLAVTKDTDRPFVVNTAKMEIQVLGTQFNVSAYDDDETQSVVLVEGSVAVRKKKDTPYESLKSIIIEPNDKAHFRINKMSEEIKVENVSIGKYISWKNGELLFIDDRFDLILKKLERHYNVEILIEDPLLKIERFTGRFNNESILEVLEIFKAHTNFNYKVKENKIVITKS